MFGGLLTLAAGPIVAAVLVQAPAVGTLAGASEPVLPSVAVADRIEVVFATRDTRPEVHDPSLIVATPPPAPPAPPLPPSVPTLGPRAVIRIVTPAPTPVPPVPGSIPAIIKAAADAHGVSYAWMLKIATCESHLNPRAYNPGGPFIGLFQFWPPTFRAHGGTDIYDPVQQSNIAATMLAHGQAGAWACA